MARDDRTDPRAHRHIVRAEDLVRSVVIGTVAADGPTQCSGLPVIGNGPDELARRSSPPCAAATARDEHHHTPSGVEQDLTGLVLPRRAGPSPSTVGP